LELNLIGSSDNHLLGPESLLWPNLHGEGKLNPKQSPSFGFATIWVIFNDGTAMSLYLRLPHKRKTTDADGSA
jgi:hypothetical protein